MSFKAKEQWMLRAKKAPFAEIARKHGISPVTARILTNRDITGDEQIRRFLHGTLEDLAAPEVLSGVSDAVRILNGKIADGSRIRVVGDYDIDGVCATYILVTALRRLGALVDYAIPDRIRDGYGINEQIIRKADEDRIDTILTCDNGISARSQIGLAKELGMTVIVTDHHEVPLDEAGEEILPPADVVIDPKSRRDTSPFREICGAVVAWKLVRQLYLENALPPDAWLEYLEFAALATVGDVMPLRDENRVIVKEGLRRIGRSRNLGLRKLVEKTELDPDRITAYAVGFVIGPCINAGGRLETAEIALSLFLSEDEGKADALAARLCALNEQRKAMTDEGTQQAEALVDERYSGDSVLVVYLPECHESLAGIIAGRLRETYQKPSIVLTRGNGAVKGSGRSIEQYNMFRKLSEVKDLMTKFGGHPMAAGLSLPEENVDTFREALNARSGLAEEDFVEKVRIDMAMPLTYISEPLVRELELLEPFGQGNDKPQFAGRNLLIRSVRVMGKRRNVVKMILAEEGGGAVDAIWFGDGDAFLEERAGRNVMDIVYYPDINVYNGMKTSQAVIRRYRFRDEAPSPEGPQGGAR